jgi:hypothetical protein
MSWVRLLWFVPVPLLVSIYTINFGRWLLKQENKFGGICTIAFAVIVFVVPLLVYMSKQ